MADAAASKAAEATHVGSTPTFPTRFERKNAGKRSHCTQTVHGLFRAWGGTVTFILYNRGPRDIK